MERKKKEHYYLPEVESLKYDVDYHYIPARMVEVSEEVYYGIRKYDWKYEKKDERDKKCIIGNKHGKAIRCNKNCSSSHCPYTPNGTPLSLDAPMGESDDDFSLHDIHKGDDYFNEFNGTSGADFNNYTNADISDILTNKMLLEALFQALEELDPESLRICQAIMNEETDDSIAKELGYNARTSFSYHKQKVLDMLRQKLEKYR